MTIANINLTPTPILFLRNLFILKIFPSVSLIFLVIPENLKIEVKLILTPSFPFYLNNIASGSTLCVHLPIVHSALLLPLSDHRDYIPFLSIKFCVCFPFSASDRKCEWEMA